MKLSLKHKAGLLFLCFACSCGGSSNSGIVDPPGAYSTTFPFAENPISEGGKWVNGGTVGLDWADVSSGQGRAIGHEVGATFTDATAVLQNLSWGPDQKATAVVSTTAPAISKCSQEVELRLRTVISAHSITGYEFNYKYASDSTGYMQIVRWDGGVGDFTVLGDFQGQQFAVTEGDTVSATIVGTVITAYKNGVQQGQVTDSTYTSGSPGIAFNLENAVTDCPGTNSTYGFTSFSAMDSSQAF
jgi:hypothetical protein